MHRVYSRQAKYFDPSDICVTVLFSYRYPVLESRDKGDSCHRGKSFYDIRRNRYEGCRQEIRKMHIVPGSEKNIKVTTVEDLEILKALMHIHKDEWLK